LPKIAHESLTLFFKREWGGAAEMSELQVTQWQTIFSAEGEE
jgi:hypothetical protein